jgi:hypothetical protein
MEHELNITNAEEKRRKLFVKLRPELQKRITEYNVIPTIR